MLLVTFLLWVAFGLSHPLNGELSIYMCAVFVGYSVSCNIVFPLDQFSTECRKTKTREAETNELVKKLEVHACF